jgi:hypothetical protein
VTPAAGAPPDRAEQGGFLESPLADALCVVLFALAAAWLRAVLLPLLVLPAAVRAPLGLAVALLGPAACGVERGLARPPSPLVAGGLGLLSGAGHAAACAWLSPWRAPGWLAGEAVLLAVLGALLARFATRFDRGEAGWRAAVRRGPPTATSPAALSIAARRLPGWLEAALLPLGWCLRLPALLAIRLYQLTLSRLMPPACRFEPTCSRYGFEAFLRHGFARGLALTGLRVLRCSPLSDGGFDPVPPIPARPGLSEARVSSAIAAAPRAAAAREDPA